MPLGDNYKAVCSRSQLKCYRSRSSMTTDVASLRGQVSDHGVHLWNLQVVELLLPLEDVVDPGQPDVNVADQDATSGVDG